jgi:hypothetical protein
MLAQQKLAYLQKKISVARALGEKDAEAMWQHLIDELKAKIAVESERKIHFQPKHGRHAAGHS